MQEGFREKSTKTRIETNHPRTTEPRGLPSFREKSTKTRIETQAEVGASVVRRGVLEKNPPKQGLKHQ